MATFMSNNSCLSIKFFLSSEICFNKAIITGKLPMSNFSYVKLGHLLLIDDTCEINDDWFWWESLCSMHHDSLLKD